MVPREVDLNGRGEKFGGWTNPLSWTDDGTDDDRILNIRFKPLGDSEEDPWKMPKYELDEDIADSLISEHDAEKTVPKHMKRFKEEELKALEADKEREKKLLEEAESKRLKKNLGEPEETKSPKKEGKKNKKKAKKEAKEESKDEPVEEVKEEKKTEKKKTEKKEAKK